MRTFGYGFAFLLGVVCVLASTLTSGPIVAHGAVEVTRIVVVTPAVTVTAGSVFPCSGIVIFADDKGDLVICAGGKHEWRDRR